MYSLILAKLFRTVEQSYSIFFLLIAHSKYLYYNDCKGFYVLIYESIYVFRRARLLPRSMVAIYTLGCAF